MRRITNWAILTDHEKETSWRRIAERNRQRIQALKLDAHQQNSSEIPLKSGSESMNPRIGVANVAELR